RVQQFAARIAADRHILQHIERLGVEARGIDEVPGEGLAGGGVDQRPVAAGGGFGGAEITAECRGRGHENRIRLRCRAYAGGLEPGEEKKLVFADGSAERASRLVSL